MHFWGYFLISVAAVLVVFAQQINVNNTYNVESEIVRDTINSITQNYQQYAQYGGFSDAILILKNGYIDGVNGLSISEKIAMNAYSTCEDLLLKNQQAAAIESIQQGTQAALNALLDAGVLGFQCLGDGMTLSTESTKQGLNEASQLLQIFGLDLITQLEVSKNSASQGISAGGGTARQAVRAARQALQAVFIVLYDGAQRSHNIATKSIHVAHSTPGNIQLENQNAEAAAKDPHVPEAISAINRAAEEAINKGASADRVIRLKQLLVISFGDIAKIASEIREYYDYIVKLADTDPSSAVDIFRKEAAKSKLQIQRTIANVNLSFSSAASKSDNLSRKQLGVCLKTIEYANVENTNGNKIAEDLTILALGIPANVRSLVLQAAIESSRYAKVALFNRMIDAAINAFNVL